MLEARVITRGDASSQDLIVAASDFAPQVFAKNRTFTCSRTSCPPTTHPQPLRQVGTARPRRGDRGRGDGSATGYGISRLPSLAPQRALKGGDVRPYLTSCLWATLSSDPRRETAVSAG